MRVRNLMKQPVIAVGPDQTLRDAARLMHEHQIGALVVLDGGRLAGIITERDLLRAAAEARDLDGERVAACMSGQVVTAGPNYDVNVAAAMMSERHIRHLIVEDQEQVLGMLSLRDVLSVFLPEQVHGQAHG
jgi:CBS domain-containing protein